MHDIMTPTRRQMLLQEQAARARAEAREALRFDAARTDFYVGVRLAPTTEHSHLAVIRQTFSLAQGATHYAVTRLHRFDRGTPVHEIARAAQEVYGTPEIQNAFGRALVVDHTHAGMAALDAFAALDLDFAPFLVSEGQATAHNAPRRELVTTMQTLLQERRFKLSCDPAEARAFIQEAAAYRIHVGDGVTFKASREGRIATVATAVWFAEWHRFEAWGYVN